MVLAFDWRFRNDTAYRSQLEYSSNIVSAECLKHLNLRALTSQLLFSDQSRTECAVFCASLNPSSYLRPMSNFQDVSDEKILLSFGERPICPVHDKQLQTLKALENHCMERSKVQVCAHKNRPLLNNLVSLINHGGGTKFLYGGLYEGSHILFITHYAKKPSGRRSAMYNSQI